RGVNRGSFFTRARANSLVIGRGDEFGIFLRATLKGQEVVVAAAPAGEGATEGGTGPIHRAAALFRAEEAADRAKQLVGLAAHGVFAAAALDRESLLGRREGKAEMPGEALDVALGQGDQRIGATVTRAFLAIVHWRLVVHELVRDGHGHLSS